ncbi:hypothetical protein ACQF36_03325 [Streptomyces sp. Marseille-Q5077]|uniref:hypothetical protein n=1 Tax=Streptomyces sp. Marseille-Q5077 TaxID=3418995 RepID=UPI003CFE403F
MDSHIIEQYPEFAVNCFTGSFSALAGMKGHPIAEQSLFERGDAYLFQAGLDESGYPEYIFPVEEAGLLGMRRTGFELQAVPISYGDVGTQLKGLVDRFGGVVVWVNTSHLGYAEVYGRTSSYLHSIVIDEVAEDLSDLRVFDCMVVDAERFSCRARLDFAEFEKAISDRIKSDAHDCMGFFYVVTGTVLAEGRGGLQGSLREQARRFAEEDRFREAIKEYQRLCVECFADPDRSTEFGARRLFIHSTVLYSVPSLTLMSRSLDAAGASDAARELCEEAIRHWRALGVLALRYEATGSDAVMGRLNQRFAVLDDVTARLWGELA